VSGGQRDHDDRLPIDPDLAPEDPGEPSTTHTGFGHVHRARQVDVLAAVFAGGFAGALARYELGLAWRTGTGRFPWTTLTINLSGAFLLGVILTVLVERIGPTRYLRAFLCVGVLGAWTTMSTFAVEADLLVRDGHASAALAYAAATVLVGIALTWAGVTLARRLDRRPQR
jgi:CrcB protein